MSQGTESSDFTLLTDRALSGGWELFSAFLQGIGSKYEDVHFFLFEKVKNDFLTAISPQLAGKIRFYDYATDPLGWIDENSSSVVPEKFMFSDVIENIGSKNCVIVIDSLSSFLRFCNIQRFSFNIEKIHEIFSKTGKSCTFLSLLHRDLCDEVTLKCVEYLSNCIVNLVSEDELSNFTEKPKKNSPKTSKLCKIVFKKKGGRISEFIETFTIGKNTVISSKPWQPENKIKDVDVDDDSIDPVMEEEELVRSTFSLKLSQQEKEARSKLVMPYTKPPHLDVKMDGDPGQPSPGMIYYEPDEADDFDDEDPDDDLDF